MGTSSSTHSTTLHRECVSGNGFGSTCEPGARIIEEPQGVSPFGGGSGFCGGRATRARARVQQAARGLAPRRTGFACEDRRVRGCLRRAAGETKFEQRAVTTVPCL